MLVKTQPQILDLDIKAQPDDVTCGPTCLHAVYRYYNDDISLEQVIDEVKQLPTGGTLAVQLANHALRRGYKATIYTYNLTTFDLSWFHIGIDVEAKLKQQMVAKADDKKLIQASEAYLNFLSAGGEIRFEELTSTLLKGFLSQDLPVLTGLSATYLYESQRETGDQEIIYDDIVGQPTGHFVIINGYNQETRMAYVADPLAKNPISTEQYYQVRFRKLINSIMLGVMTYDANLLIIYPK